MFAKQLLHQTDLSITDVAYSSGFGSVRRVNDSFKQHFQLTPQQLRKHEKAQGECLDLWISYRPPYRWDLMQQFLAKRLIEEWDSWFLELGPNWLGRSGIDLFVERLKNQPGGVAIRRAMAASPILRALDREDNQRLAEQFAGDLIVRDSTLEYDDMVLTILVALEAVVAVVDLTYDLPSSKADRMIELCVEMQGAYLARHVPVRIKEVQ